MAKILPGLAVSKMSGTIAGTTYQNWRGMLVARSKSTPTQSFSLRRNAVQALISAISRAWRDELTPDQRIAWNQRAKNYPWLDVFGNTVFMTGLNLYIKQNFALLDHSLPRRDIPVPDIMPPELEMTVNSASTAFLDIDYSQLAPTVITDQAPFLNVVVAGGFLTAENELGTDRVSTKVDTLALPAGRQAGKSDFRHAIYVDELPLVEPAAILNDMEIAINTLTGTRNITISVQRFNKYGNFSAPRLFNIIAVKS